MKSFNSALLIIPLALLMCEEPVEDWRCILNCNPNECLVLDEENCECVTDPVCEAEKFCGGDLEDCKCKEKDGGSWCTALTSDSIKTWTYAFAYDSLKNEIITDDIINYIWFCLHGGHFRYRLDHTYYEWCAPPPTSVFTWEFDTVHQPKKIIYNCLERYGNPCTILDEYERIIIKLNSDTLILSWPYENEFKGWIAYVPYDY